MPPSITTGNVLFLDKFTGSFLIPLSITIGGVLCKVLLDSEEDQ